METEEPLDEISPGQPEWFCVRSRPKSEHIAARHLRESGIDVFLPRIRFKRLTRRGPVWFTEALFPGYFFACFNWAGAFRQVRATNGVTTIVHFGEHWPTIPPQAILEMQELFGAESVREINTDLHVGDEVKIATGPFQGLLAVVNQVLPAPERVRVLLEFLGRQTSVEIQVSALIPATEPRAVAMEPPAEA